MVAIACIFSGSCSPVPATKREIQDLTSIGKALVDNNTPSYVIGRGPFFHPADVTISPPLEYTATGKYSVFAPPHGDFFPFGGRFYWPKFF